MCASPPKKVEQGKKKGGWCMWEEGEGGWAQGGQALQGRQLAARCAPLHLPPPSCLAPYLSQKSPKLISTRSSDCEKACPKIQWNPWQTWSHSQSLARSIRWPIEPQRSSKAGVTPETINKENFEKKKKQRRKKSFLVCHSSTDVQ